MRPIGIDHSLDPGLLKALLTSLFGILLVDSGSLQFDFYKEMQRSLIPI